MRTYAIFADGWHAVQTFPSDRAAIWQWKWGGGRFVHPVSVYNSNGELIYERK